MRYLFSTSYTMKKIELKDVAEIRSGFYLKPSPTGSVYYLQMKDLLGQFSLSAMEKVDCTKKMEKNILCKGDLLFAGKGGAYLCKVFNVDVKALPSTTLFIIRIKSDVVSPDYLCWYLNHPVIMAEVKASQVGTGTLLVHKPTLERLKIAVPEMEQQRKIVDISNLQKREMEILQTLGEKRLQLTNQILMNELNNNRYGE